MQASFDDWLVERLFHRQSSRTPVWLKRTNLLSGDLDGLLSWIACIADGQPLTAYIARPSATNLVVRIAEEHNHVLAEFVNGIRTRLLAAEVAAELQKLVLQASILRPPRRRCYCGASHFRSAQATAPDGVPVLEPSSRAKSRRAIDSTVRGESQMKSLLLLTASGPLLVLTSHESLHDPKLLEEFKARGAGKFVAFEVPLALAKDRYGWPFSNRLKTICTKRTT